LQRALLLFDHCVGQLAPHERGEPLLLLLVCALFITFKVENRVPVLRFALFWDKLMAVPEFWAL